MFIKGLWYVSNKVWWTCGSYCLPSSSHPFDSCAQSYYQVISILCTANCNLGSLRSNSIPLMKQVLDPLGMALAISLKPDWHDGAAAYY